MNPQTHTLTKLPDMKVKRVGASVIFVPHNSLLPSKNGYLYVLGGRTDHKVKTKLCERYNIET